VVRQQKYTGDANSFGSQVEKLIAVGGLRDKRDLWPDSLAQLMQVRVRAHLGSALKRFVTIVVLQACGGGLVALLRLNTNQAMRTCGARVLHAGARGDAAACRAGSPRA
jgi:hypothetical protein